MKYLLIVSLLFSFHSIAESTHQHHGHDHSNHGHHNNHGHHHSTIEVSHLEDAPAITKMEVTKDPVKGYNLYFQTKNFTFAPMSAGLENIMGEGHAHLYINGKKITRLYGNWFYINKLPHGKNMIEVTLNANDHSDYTFFDVRISAHVKVEVH